MVVLDLVINKQLDAFLAQRQGKRITKNDVRDFRTLICKILEEQGEKPDDSFRYSYLLEDMLQLHSFQTTIPMKGLKKYLKFRSNPVGYEYSDRTEAKMLDKLGEFLCKSSNPRSLFEEEWWKQ